MPRVHRPHERLDVDIRGGLLGMSALSQVSALEAGRRFGPPFFGRPPDIPSSPALSGTSSSFGAPSKQASESFLSKYIAAGQPVYSSHNAPWMPSPTIADESDDKHLATNASAHNMTRCMDRPHLPHPASGKRSSATATDVLPGLAAEVSTQSWPRRGKAAASARYAEAPAHHRHHHLHSHKQGPGASGASQSARQTPKLSLADASSATMPRLSLPGPRGGGAGAGKPSPSFATDMAQSLPNLGATSLRSTERRPATSKVISSGRKTVSIPLHHNMTRAAPKPAERFHEPADAAPTAQHDAREAQVMKRMAVLPEIICSTSQQTGVVTRSNRKWNSSIHPSSSPKARGRTNKAAAAPSTPDSREVAGKRGAHDATAWMAQEEAHAAARGNDKQEERRRSTANVAAVRGVEMQKQLGMDNHRTNKAHLKARYGYDAIKSILCRRAAARLDEASRGDPAQQRSDSAGLSDLPQEDNDGAVARAGAASLSTYSVRAEFIKAELDEEDVLIVPTSLPPKSARDSGNQEDGADKYYERCSILGEFPLTKIQSQLRSEICHLAHSSLSLSSCAALGSALAVNQVITSLDVSDSISSGQAMRRLLEALLANSTLKELNVSNNMFDADAFTMLGEVVTPKKVQGNNIQIKFKKSLKLKKLVVNGCKMDGATAVYLAGALNGHFNTIQDLSLSNNLIEDVGAMAIGSMLYFNSNIHRLDLSWNQIKSAGSSGLCGNLEHNKSLTSLSMAWNGLYTEGGNQFANMLRTNQCLRELDLSNTRINSEVCMVLADCVCHNTAIRTLKLDHNICGYHGGRHLMDMLERATTLRQLTLEGCSFARDGRSQVLSTYAEFDAWNCQKRYKLDLECIPERAILSFLCGIEAKYPGSMRKVTLNGRNMLQSHSQSSCFELTDVGYPNNLAKDGVFRVEMTCMGNKSSRDPEAISDELVEKVCSQMTTKRMHDSERLSLLELVSNGRFFTSIQAKSLLSHFQPGLEKLSAQLVLFFRLVSWRGLDNLFVTVWESQRIHRTLGTHLFFRASNPTGHYILNLSIPVDRLLAKQLVTTSIVCESGARTWRNVSFLGKCMHLTQGAPRDWVHDTPDDGVLRFDYVSSLVPGREQVFSDTELRLFLTSHVFSTAAERADDQSGADQICRLRGSSPDLVITCTQATFIIDLFRFPDERAEAAIILHARVVDPENRWKIWEELNSLEQRYYGAHIGWDNVVPLVLQAKASTGLYSFEFRSPEHRDMVKLLCDKAVADDKMTNWNNFILNGRANTHILEDRSMWSVVLNSQGDPDDITAEFDYFGDNIWQKLEIDKPTTREARSQVLEELAKRLAFRRMIAMHRYWKDEKNFKDRPKRDLPLIRGGLFKDKFIPSRYNFMGAEEPAVAVRAANLQKPTEMSLANAKRRTKHRKSMQGVARRRRSSLFKKQDSFVMSAREASALGENRNHSWQIAWDAMMRARMPEDAVKFLCPMHKAPLRHVFETFADDPAEGMALFELDALLSANGFNEDYLSFEEREYAFLVATTKWDKTTLLWCDFEDVCAAIVDEIPEFAMPESYTGVLNGETSDSPVRTRSKPMSGSTFGGAVAREFSNDEPGRVVTTH